MKKFWNFIKNEDTSETELLFNGPISEDTWWGDEVTPALFRDELSKVSGNLTVWLNSPGGDVFAASQIYSMLKNHKGKVTVKIDGVAASAASVVAMAGEEEAFFVGDGKGKPTGIFNTVGGAEDGATTTGASITFDDVMELFYSLRSPYRKKAVWVLNDSTVKALRKLKDNTGNYIWNPSVQAGVPDTILNRP